MPTVLIILRITATLSYDKRAYSEKQAIIAFTISKLEVYSKTNRQCVRLEICTRIRFYIQVRDTNINHQRIEVEAVTHKQRETL